MNKATPGLFLPITF